MATTSEIVEKLNLQPHTEGGFYAETLRDTSIVLSSSQLPSEYKVDRAISTSIYFLLPAGNVSLLHRIPCAETWHFYLGEPLTFPIFHPVEFDVMKIMTILYPVDLICAVISLLTSVKPANKLLKVLELNEKNGQVKLTSIGPDLLGDNQQPQYTVPPYVWFGAFPTKDYIISPDGMVAKAATRDAESHYSLVGCTCAPAFQFEDFELAKRSYLISRFPNHEPLISLLTLPE
ncbi:hypothetical protein SADUNF_Sadunf06G0114900 [Salix dunnii]|uniref:DUF985 domain-containing protein n=1 Tax=Salix dunnii TaxID=1413687 RepID=A0A835N2Z2_9ROSI|nr:hypothetical protein SADUNF_Sadunf06G0114900 [Salix dunnii]